MLYTYTTAYLPVLNLTASLYTPSVFNEVNLLKALMIFLSTVVVALLLHTKPKSVELELFAFIKAVIASALVTVFNAFNASDSLLYSTIFK